MDGISYLQGSLDLDVGLEAAVGISATRAFVKRGLDRETINRVLLTV